MYLIDVGAPTIGQRYTYSVLFPLVTYGAPEGARTPNPLIRSAKFTQSGHDYLTFACSGYRAEDTSGTRRLELMESPMDKIHVTRQRGAGGGRAGGIHRRAYV
jgi:hypothetical protein